MSVMRLPSGRWRVQVRRKGFPPFDQVFATEAEARAKERAAKEQHEALLVPQRMSLEAVWESYSASFEYQGKAARTQATEATFIKPVLAALGTYGLSVLEQAPHLVHDYIDRRCRHVSPRTKRRLSPNSVRLEVAALSAVVAWAKKRRMVASNFVRHIDRPGQTKRSRRVSTGEQAAIGDAVGRRDDPKLAEAARFAMLLRLLGCRPGELAGVFTQDIEFYAAELLFRETKYKRQPRRIPLDEESLNLLDAQLLYARDAAPDSPYLFSTRSREPDEQGGLWRPFNFSGAVKRLRAAGVVSADFHAHAMRREFVSRAIEAGLTYGTIRKMTGHHSTQAIEIYDQGLATAPELRDALAKHLRVVRQEQLLAQLRQMGATPEQLESLAAELRGEKPKQFKRRFASK